MQRHVVWQGLRVRATVRGHDTASLHLRFGSRVHSSADSSAGRHDARMTREAAQRLCCTANQLASASTKRLSRSATVQRNSMSHTSWQQSCVAWRDGAREHWSQTGAQLGPAAPRPPAPPRLLETSQLAFPCCIEARPLRIGPQRRKLEERTRSSRAACDAHCLLPAGPGVLSVFSACRSNPRTSHAPRARGLARSVFPLWRASRPAPRRAFCSFVTRQSAKQHSRCTSPCQDHVAPLGVLRANSDMVELLGSPPRAGGRSTSLGARWREAEARRGALGLPSRPLVGLVLSWMVLCGLLAASGAQAASAAPCAATQHRRLLQSPASPANAASGPIIETVEVDVVSQVRKLGAGRVLDAVALRVRRGAEVPARPSLASSHGRSCRRAAPTCWDASGLWWSLAVLHCGRSPGRSPLLLGAPQECIMLMNLYYDAAALGVVELAAPSANQADSARDCCALCHDSRTSCNAFQWCVRQLREAPAQAAAPPRGCAAPCPPHLASRAALTPPPLLHPPARRCPEAQGCNLGSVSFPYRGCQLLDLSGYLNASVNTGAIKQDGPGVPFTAGRAGMQAGCLYARRRGARVLLRRARAHAAQCSAPSQLRSRAGGERVRRAHLLARWPATPPLAQGRPSSSRCPS